MTPHASSSSRPASTWSASWWTAVAEVIELRMSEVESAPNVGGEENSRYIQGVASIDGELLIMVDLNKLLSDEEWMALGSM